MFALEKRNIKRFLIFSTTKISIYLTKMVRNSNQVLKNSSSCCALNCWVMKEHIYILENLIMANGLC